MCKKMVAYIENKAGGFKIKGYKVVFTYNGNTLPIPYGNRNKTPDVMIEPGIVERPTFLFHECNPLH